MASPGYRFRAHQSARLCFRELYRPRKAGRKFWCFHVVGKSAKAGVVPAQIYGGLLCLAQPAELLQVHVSDAGFAQGWSERVATELRVVPRAGNDADIDHALHAVGLQQFEKLVEAPR